MFNIFSSTPTSLISVSKGEVIHTILETDHGEEYIALYNSRTWTWMHAERAIQLWENLDKEFITRSEKSSGEDEKSRWASIADLCRNSWLKLFDYTNSLNKLSLSETAGGRYDVIRQLFGGDEYFNGMEVTDHIGDSYAVKRRSEYPDCWIVSLQIDGFAEDLFRQVSITKFSNDPETIKCLALQYDHVRVRIYQEPLPYNSWRIEWMGGDSKTFFSATGINKGYQLFGTLLRLAREKSEWEKQNYVQTELSMNSSGPLKEGDYVKISKIVASYLPSYFCFPKELQSPINRTFAPILSSEELSSLTQRWLKQHENAE